MLILPAPRLWSAPPRRKSRSPPTTSSPAAPASAWRAIDPDDLLVMDLASGGRVVIQLAPAFAPVHVANVKALARGNYWDGATVYRLQDNYVAQWGLNESDRPWPAGVTAKPPAEYVRPLKGLADQAARICRSLCARHRFFRRLAGRLQRQGGLGQPRPLLWQRRGRPRPVARHRDRRRIVRGHRPGAEAARPQHRPDRAGDRGDRQAELAARAGPRRSASTRTRPNMCRSRASGWRATCRRASGRRSNIWTRQSAAFASYVRLRANRKDAFYDRPAGGVDLCNVQVPVRKKG